MTGRERLGAVAAYLACLAGLTPVLGISDRYPVPWWLVLAAFVLVNLGAGVLLGQWRWLALSLLWLPVGVVAAAMLESPLVTLSAPVLVVLAFVLLAVGIGVRKLVRRDLFAGRRATAVAGSMLGSIALVAVVTEIDKHRTVRAERSRPLAIDERRGTIGGVGIGDPASRVRSAFGPAPRWDEDELTGPLDGPDDAGPQGLQGPPGRLDFLRYRKLSFAMSDGRAWSIDIAERNARTSRGVGVGDSISLVRDAYPSFRCGEGDLGSDEPIPFPYCTGRVGRRTYIYFSGEYSRPGSPVVSITLAPEPMD